MRGIQTRRGEALSLAVRSARLRTVRRARLCMALWKPLSRARRRRIYDRPPAATLRAEYRNPPTASCVSRISPPLYCGSPYDLRLEDHGFDPLLFNNLRQVVRSRVPLSSNSKFGTGQWALMPMPCGWEGSRRSGVALTSKSSVVYPRTSSRLREGR